MNVLVDCPRCLGIGVIEEELGMVYICPDCHGEGLVERLEDTPETTLRAR